MNANNLTRIVSIADTKANIEALSGSPNETLVGFSTDTSQLGYSTDGGSTWTWLGATGTASGDLSGSYPDPTVAGLQGRDLASTAPSTNQAIVWSGSEWAPADQSGGGLGAFGLLVEDGATSPPVSLYSEDGTDWLYADG